MCFFRFVVLTYFFCFCSSAFCLSVLASTDYPLFCQKAAHDDQTFSSFRRDPIYQGALEHVSYTQGLEYLKIIQNKYPELLQYLPQFLTSERIGNPITYEYKGIGKISPTTLRYIKVAADLMDEFGNLREKHIVEIGGGYGGLCKILHDLGGFASYTLIDLPECLPLIKRYLECFEIPNVYLLDNAQLDQLGNCDLLVSNYAFSEIDRKEQKDYLDRVILPATSGYMIYNFVSSLYFGLESYSVEEILKELSQNNHQVRLELEQPSTGDIRKPNVLIKWKSQSLKDL